MLAFTATIKNAKEAKEWGQHLLTEFDRRAFKLMTVYALRIEKEAKLAVPVQTNFLRSSIHTRVWVTGKRIFARIGTNVHYAPYVEFGTGLYGPMKRKYIIRPRFKKALAFGPMQAGTEFGMYATKDISLMNQGLVRAGKRIRKGGMALVQHGLAEMRTGRALYRSAKSNRLITSRGKGAMTVRKFVIHPGVHPRAYLLPAFERNIRPFRSDLTKLAAIKFKE